MTAFWRHCQLADSVAMQHRHTKIKLTVTKYEFLQAANDPLPHLISAIYKILDAAKFSPTPFSVQEYERDLQREFKDEQLHHLYRLTHSSSVDAKTQENNYKLLSRLYRVPSSLARIYPSTSDLC